MKGRWVVFGEERDVWFERSIGIRSIACELCHEVCTDLVCDINLYFILVSVVTHARQRKNHTNGSYIDLSERWL